MGTHAYSTLVATCGHFMASSSDGFLRQTAGIKEDEEEEGYLQGIIKVLKHTRDMLLKAIHSAAALSFSLC